MGTSWNYKDLTGQRFGKLLVTQRTDRKDSSGGIIWECRCDCGSTIHVRSTNLLQGRKTDCGCVKDAKKAEREAARKARKEENARLRAEKKAQREAEAKVKREQKARERAEKELARKAKNILEAKERVPKTEEELWQEKMAEYTRWGMQGTLCWNCIRSAAPPGLQCIWDKSKGRRLPEGAEYDGYLNDNGVGYGVIVTSCPLFLPLYERKNAELLEREREKNRMRRADDFRQRMLCGIRKCTTER